jgi:peptidoglycan/LPS O-acetylase OafA/YrhL
VFAKNAWPHAVNGSLWSLPVEFFMYLLLALIGVVGALVQAALNTQRATAWLVGGMSLLFIALAALWALPTQEAMVVYRTDLRHIPMCGVYFMLGASLYCFKWEKHFTLSNVLLALVAWLSLSHRTQWFAMASWLVLPFVVMAFGLARHPWLGRMHTRDYSYGIYIYAFPVQQTVASFWPQMPLTAYLLSTFVITVALAATSWHFVEKPALKLKPFRG